MIDRYKAFGLLREEVGNPDLQNVSDRWKLASYLESAIEWLAGEFAARIVTTTLSLEAGVYSYPMPPDVQEILRLDWNSNTLTFGSTAGWHRDRRNWRNASTVDTLGEFAVEGLNLVFFPPPSATAVSTAGTYDLTYVAGGLEMTAGGVPGFSTYDMWVCIYKAADLYLGNHPTQENAARREQKEKEWRDRLPTARGHRQHRPAKIQVRSYRS